MQSCAHTMDYKVRIPADGQTSIILCPPSSQAFETIMNNDRSSHSSDIYITSFYGGRFRLMVWWDHLQKIYFRRRHVTQQKTNMTHKGFLQPHWK